MVAWTGDRCTVVLGRSEASGALGQSEESERLFGARSLSIYKGCVGLDCFLSKVIISEISAQARARNTTGPNHVNSAWYYSRYPRAVR